MAASSAWDLDIDPDSKKRIIWWGLVSSGLAMLIAVLVLFGWGIDSQFLIRLRPHYVALKPNTAIVFILFSFSYSLLAIGKLRSFTKARMNLFYFLTCTGTVFALLSGVQDIFSFDLGIDTLFTKKDLFTNGSPNPGRISPLESLCFFLLGSNLLLNGKMGSSSRLTPYSSLVVMTIAFGTIITYLYGAPYLSGLGKYNSMALHASIAFIFASVAALLIFVSKHPLTIFAKGPATFAARLLFPLVIFGPVIAGWLRWIAEDFGIVEGKYGTAFLVTILVVLMSYVTYFLLSQIDQQYKRQLESQRLSDERQELLNFKEKLVSGLVHDIRSPLTVARVSAEVMNRAQTSQDHSLLLGNRIVKAIDRCDRMLKDLLDSAKMESGHKLKPQIASLNLSAVLSQAIQNVRDSMHPKGEIRLNCPNGLTGVSSEDFLLRITENLLSNAIKYGSEASPITVTAESVKEKLHLSVHNWGVVISQDQIKDLFELFSRQASANGRAQGWGVGLTAVKSLANNLGGKVEVQSSAEAGTIFLVVVPLPGS